MARGVVWGNLKVWEATSLRAFSGLVRTSERFLDVGAYSGIYSLIACADGPGEAIAFQPNPVIRPLLERNIKANGWEHRITVVPKGASDTSATARMTIPDDTTAARVDDAGVGPTIELTTIDEVLGGRRVDIIKVERRGSGSTRPSRCSRDACTLQAGLILESLTERGFEDIRVALQPHGYDRCEHLAPHERVLTTKYIELGAFANFLWTTGDTK